MKAAIGRRLAADCHRRRLPFFCFLLGFSSCCSALNPSTQILQYAHNSWRMGANGLMGAPVSIAQTVDGYIWIGTGAGLFRFDGVRFTRWTPEGNPDAAGEDVYYLHGARDGSLYLGSAQRGLIRVQNRRLVAIKSGESIAGPLAEDSRGVVWSTPTQHPSTDLAVCSAGPGPSLCYGARDNLPCANSGSIAVDAEDMLWIGGHGRICHWRPGTQAQLFTLPAHRLHTTDVQVAAMAVDKAGSVWAGVPALGDGYGLLHFTGGDWKTYITPNVDGRSLKISTLFVDRVGALWIGTVDKGIYRLVNGKTDHFDTTDGLTGNAVSQIFEDREGSLWVITSQGVDHFREFSVLTYTARQGLPDTGISAVASGGKEIWAGTQAGLYTLDTSADRFSKYPKALPMNEVEALYRDQAGRMWMAGEQRVAYLDHGRFVLVHDGHSSTLGPILELEEDGQHELWAIVSDVTKGKSLLLHIRDRRVIEKYAQPSSSEHALLRSFTANPKGGLWVNTADNKLLWFHDGRFESMSLPGSILSVTHLHSDAGGLWSATDRGLLRMEDGSVRLLSRRNGLPCGKVLQMLEDHNQALWLTMSCGFVRISNAELLRWKADENYKVKATVFDVLDGANPGNSTSLLALTDEGILWFSNGHTIQSIAPNRLPQNPAPPPVYIESLTANHRSRPFEGTVQLPSLTQDIEVRYTGLSYVIPDRVKFRYRLQGRDKAWNEVGPRREAFHGPLGPGNYVFQVIACNNDNVWNEEGATLRFRIAPAWYQTVWFRIIAPAHLIVLLYFLYKREKHRYALSLRLRFDERLEERTRIARDLHDTLLQTIQGSKLATDLAQDRANDPSLLKEALQQVSKWLDQAINEGRTALESLRAPSATADDLALDLYSAASDWAPNNLHVEFSSQGTSHDMHPSVRDEIYKIGSEAIRNACRHSGGTSLDIQVHYGKDLILLVRDNGSGFDRNIANGGRPGHFGIVGMRERASKINGTLKLHTNKSEGTRVILTVPGTVVFTKPS
jgi:ligand-binding sensor domain-containing protein